MYMCGRIVLEQLNKIYEVYTSEKPKYIIEVYVKFTDSGLSVFFILLFIFIFILFYFLFSIFRTARVRTDQSRCHISHNLMA